MEKILFFLLKKSPKKFRWFLLWRGLTSPSPGTGTWSLAGDGICVSLLPASNKTSQIGPTTMSLWRILILHTLSKHFIVDSWNLKLICPYRVFPTSSLQFMHHSLGAEDHAPACDHPCSMRKEAIWFKCKGDNYLTDLEGNLASKAETQPGEGWQQYLLCDQLFDLVFKNI